MHSVIKDVTKNIVARSSASRDYYLTKIHKASQDGVQRKKLHCGNLAHACAAENPPEKASLRAMQKPNIAIISAYNDMLSAHKPYEKYPTQLKLAILEAGGVAQFAGGVPAMCDGVTQGQPGMDLSLMSRDVIAMSTAIALSHNMFDGGLLLGICDKIVPGLLIAALTVGHLPYVFVPAGPMPSGIPNKEKAKVRRLYAEGKVNKAALMDAEAASYHAPGTCTFFGTANSNQLLMELMGLQLPGSSFVQPQMPLRQALTKKAAQTVLSYTALAGDYLPIGQLMDAKNLVNGLVGLLATGGSTNHTMHLVAIAKACGYLINWDDFARLSAVTPLLARIYPNGAEDINRFQDAGGMAVLIHNLLDNELVHQDVATVAGFGLERYTAMPKLEGDTLEWVDGPKASLNEEVLTSVDKPFATQGGLQVLSGSLGRAVIKTSALEQDKLRINAPAVVFSNQEALHQAFVADTLNKDCVIVVRYQGPKACGMPELHQLTPVLSALQNRGYNVALVTDGRMSGASGSIPAAIHVTPEAVDGGVIGLIQSGDEVLLDVEKGILQLNVSADELARRTPEYPDLSANYIGVGRELFGVMRRNLTGAEQGACSLFETREEHV